MVTESPLLSVLIPVHNGQDYLAETIAGVLDLGVAQMEVIVIDDGSTDATPALVASFGDCVRYERQPQRGTAAARNRGLQLARGAFVGFLDADDLWTPGILRALHLLSARPEFDIVHGRLREFRGALDAGVGGTLHFLTEPYRFINLGSAIYRRQVFDRVGCFDETLLFAEDHDWCLRAYEAAIPKLCIDDVILLYRIHERGLTYGKNVRETGLLRAQKRAIERRRAGRVMPPPGFPTLVEYLGVRAARIGQNGQQRPASPGPVEGIDPVRPGQESTPVGYDQDDGQLVRQDGRSLDLPPDPILCFLVVRNEVVRLSYHLSYYRRLGIDRFFIVDNGSTDGTFEWLLDQPDVHVWSTRASFRAARCGTDWVEQLLRQHGVDQWCLVVDADELLCYPDCETRGLRQLCASLDQAGKRAFMAILLDMYSERPLRETVYRQGLDVRELCPFFDRQFYHYTAPSFFGHDEHPSYFGGLRQRAFGGQEPGHDARFFYCLNKVPLLKYHPSFVLYDNLHWTSCRELADESGALLHFKYISTFAMQAEEESRRQEHWQGGLQYQRYAAALRQHPDLVLYDPALSVRLIDSRQLEALGVIHRPSPKQPA